MINDVKETNLKLVKIVKNCKLINLKQCQITLKYPIKAFICTGGHSMYELAHCSVERLDISGRKNHKSTPFRNRRQLSS